MAVRSATLRPRDIRQVLAETVETTLAQRPPFGDPGLGRTHNGRLDHARPGPSHLLRAEQTARLEHLDVLEHSCKGHGHRPAELADRGRPRTEALQHRAPTRVRERVKDAVKIDVVKHSLQHCSQPTNSQVVA